MKEQLRQRWEQLAPRDQRILKHGGMFLLALVVLRLFWWPLYDRVNVLQQEINSESSLLSWMAPRVSQLLAAKQSNLGITKDKSLPGFEKSLQQAGLKPYVKEFSQNAQGQVSVTFVEVPFESCMEWVEQVQRQGWTVQVMNAVKGEKSGITQVELVLS